MDMLVLPPDESIEIRLSIRSAAAVTARLDVLGGESERPMGSAQKPPGTDLFVKVPIVRPLPGGSRLTIRATVDGPPGTRFDGRLSVISPTAQVRWEHLYRGLVDADGRHVRDVQLGVERRPDPVIRHGELRQPSPAQSAGAPDRQPPAPPPPLPAPDRLTAPGAPIAPRAPAAPGAPAAPRPPSAPGAPAAPRAPSPPPPPAAAPAPPIPPPPPTSRSSGDGSFTKVFPPPPPPPSPSMDWSESTMEHSADGSDDAYETEDASVDTGGWAARPSVPHAPSPARATPPSPASARPPSYDMPMPAPASAGSGWAGGHRAAPKTEKPKAEPGVDYEVWFGTNRRYVREGDAAAGFSGEREETAVHYGTCTVHIPESHRIGSLGSSRLRRFFQRLRTGHDDKLRLKAIEGQDPARHWETLRKRIASFPAGSRHGVVFVHGYNVSFEGAALRAAQIGFDLQVKGAMSFFSWPSHGTEIGYPADEATIDTSEGAIADYLVAFARESRADAVHVIAHSMGNRGVLRAVNRIVGDAERRSGVHFAHCVLAAPDVDAQLFRQLCPAYASITERTTLYVSRRDKAVALSRFVHDAPRVGFAPPIQVLDGIDTVNVTNVDLTMLGHGYVAEAREVLTDMHQLMFANLPPERRATLRPVDDTGGRRYWELRA